MNPSLLSIADLTTPISCRNLEINEGDIIGISGPSGSGKSQLLRAIADIQEHDGDIYLKGTHYLDIPAIEWRSQVALLTAESHWWADHIEEHYQTPDLLELESLGLSKQLLQKNPNECSTGERQRLAVLRIMENRPRVVLLDEPTASLDRESIEQMESYLLEIAAKGTAMIWVSHDEGQLDRIGFRRYILTQGELIEKDAD